MSMFEEQGGFSPSGAPKMTRRPLGDGTRAAYTLPPTGHRRADEWAAQEHTTAVREDRGCWHCWGIAQGIAAAKSGSVPATFPTADERDGSPLPEGYVWLGALSGWEVGIMRHRDHGEAVCLYHRCGWAEPLRPEGIASDHSVFLGNLVVRALEVAADHTCAPYEPSEEHKARVARWEALDPHRGTMHDRAAAERVSGPPAPLLYADAPGLATPQHVDGPGCTPAFTPGVLRAVRGIANATASANVECLGDQCTGCSDSQCWTVRADGGDV